MSSQSDTTTAPKTIIPPLPKNLTENLVIHTLLNDESSSSSTSSTCSYSTTSSTTSLNSSSTLYAATRPSSSISMRAAQTKGGASSSQSTKSQSSPQSSTKIVDDTNKDLVSRKMRETMQICEDNTKNNKSRPKSEIQKRNMEIGRAHV